MNNQQTGRHYLMPISWQVWIAPLLLTQKADSEKLETRLTLAYQKASTTNTHTYIKKLSSYYQCLPT